MAKRNWCFTINNFTPEDDPLKFDCTYVVYQHEIGKEGTPHYQGYCEFDKLMRMSALKKIHPRASWHLRKGNQQQAIDYCSLAVYKGEDKGRVAGPWTTGTPKKQGERTSLEEFGQDLVDNKRTFKEVCTTNPGMALKYAKNIQTVISTIAEDYAHDDVRGHWYVGPPGTGKSHAARAVDPDYYMKPQNKWFDGYEGQKLIILDDLDRGGVCLGHYLKMWADKYAVTSEIKCSTVKLQHHKFIVTSNYTINELWGDDPVMCEAISRRFKVREFNGPPTIF